MNFTFFSSAHGIFSRIDHILGHKSSLGKFKKIEIIPSIFSDHNAVRLDLTQRPKHPVRRSGRTGDMMRMMEIKTGLAIDAPGQEELLWAEQLREAA